MSIEGEPGEGRTSVLCRRLVPADKVYQVADLNQCTHEGLRQLHLVYKRLSEWCEREIRVRIEKEKGNVKMAATLSRVNEELYISLPPWARW